MDEKLFTAKALISATASTMAALLGWKGIMLVVWVGAMLLDYISGTAAACKVKTWCSETARQGLWHKGGMILVVAVAAITDGLIVVIGDHLPLGLSWPGLLLPLVVTWYIITELGSILENAVKMGVVVPGWLEHILKVGLKAVNEAGEVAVGEDDTEETVQ